ncbi:MULTISPECIES: nicotinate-nucleotide--dimethylbenzimidazole phosphoribosyltransferase [unclassified Aeromicrobium]|uniref:nicotinate-nucleotide--dimethylbenzimidazole phosphoribosyltransferase n=1 Tax=unclassified Aeromicrobium TaxID=2633570 RepID=UPI00288B60F9|nr:MULTISPECIES: nicotinate-nucleotide--dimethylbenzimidazole phosphoribosyltransferase [unclassified Aeromicrobium]
MPDHSVPDLTSPTSVRPPDAAAHAAAAARLADLATPPGALGRLGDLACWIAATQGEVPPRPVENVRAVVLAGDHGVVGSGVSAFPSAVTAAMVRTFASGRAGVSVLAAQHGVSLRVLDLGVDDDLDGLPDEVRAFKVRRGCGSIDVEDALTPEETALAIEHGRTIAAQEIASGAQLLVTGDMGIGNTTPSAALVAASLGLPGVEVVGRGTGIDDAGLARKAEVVQTALDRAGERVADPVDRLTALGSADLAATVGFLVAAAEAGVPVLLDGLISVACGLTADDLAPGAAAWFAAGHRSTEPAQGFALEKLGLEPLLDVGMRLGEGSGAVAAVPLVRSAALLLRDVALLSEVLGG